MFTGYVWPHGCTMPHAYDMALCDSYVVTHAVLASRFLLYIAFTVMEF
jgi:hypothetical protein